jgi:hypothetical protein
MIYFRMLWWVRCVWVEMYTELWLGNSSKVAAWKLEQEMRIMEQVFGGSNVWGWELYWTDSALYSLADFDVNTSEHTRSVRKVSLLECNVIIQQWIMDWEMLRKYYCKLKCGLYCTVTHVWKRGYLCLI